MSATRDTQRTIELRSDTFTLPTAGMLTAIAAAPLGDECYREDPTVRALEQQAAAMLRKEAACLMPSGTMANLASVLSHCAEREAPVVLLGDRSDLWVYEDRSVPTWAGIRFQPLPTQADGSLPLADIAAHLPADATGASALSGSGPAALLVLESPHNLCGGVVLSMDYLREAAALAHARGTLLHLDGARLFNATVRLGIDAADIARDADSVQFCLSKGLAAPVGSMVAGSADFIARARDMRKRLGGDMHQAGIIAAAGLVGLTQMIARLHEDHAHARRLAEALASLPGIELDLHTVQTNTVVFRIVDATFSCAGFLDALAADGVRMSEFMFGRIRAVTHHGIRAEDIDRTVACVGRVLAARRRDHAAASHA